MSRDEPTMDGSSTATLRERPGARAKRRAPAAAPVVLDRYRLHRRLGSGAFGTVWMARDERLDRDVAVKIVPRERIVGGRFEREARAAARLAHPGIVTLYEAGADDDGAYLVSELVRGATLDQLLAAGRLSDRDIVEIGVCVCRALAHAHDEQVVHRDVKPSNILVPSKPATPAERAKLTDFGVARVVGGDSLTRTGDVIGTAAYMAPEQAAGREAGVAADIYSLAVVLYEALTGVNPLRLHSTGQRQQRLAAHLAPLRRQRRDLPRELAQGIDRALRPKPRERGSIADLEAALLASAAELGDVAGVVAPPLRPRLTGPGDGDERAAAAEDPSAHPPGPGRLWSPRPHGTTQRAAAALASACLTAWICAHLLAPAPVPISLAALAAAVAVAVSPRIGWLALTAAGSAALALQHEPGVAVALALAALLPLLLMPLDATAWPLAAGAPALGSLGLAAAWPALAGRARSPWRRAGLGAAGWLWLLIAEPVTRMHLALGLDARLPPASRWTGSAAAAGRDVLGPLLTSGAWAPALIWAAAAVVLPWLVRGRSLTTDALRVGAWSLVTAVGTAAAIPAAGLTAAAGVRGIVAGAALGILIALAGTLAAGLRDGRLSRRSAGHGEATPVA